MRVRTPLVQRVALPTSRASKAHDPPVQDLSVRAHNNFVERQIEQYALGRKLWMFCYEKVGAQASANLLWTKESTESHSSP
jgi:Transposase IS66 family